MKKIILICGLLASSFSFGADWNIYSVSIDDSYISTYDKDSIKQVGVDSYKVWTNTTDQKQQVNLVINNYINCKNETVVQSDIYIYKDGKLLNSLLDLLQKSKNDQLIGFFSYSGISHFLSS